ncbi:hypothetical protein GJ496_006084 [Pomphorhynchus laevis]|nr:hypothetical protein GJ496_006084 [Pomphorhynchus laevis]
MLDNIHLTSKYAKCTSVQHLNTVDTIDFCVFLTIAAFTSFQSMNLKCLCYAQSDGDATSNNKKNHRIYCDRIIRWNGVNFNEFQASQVYKFLENESVQYLDIMIIHYLIKLTINLTIINSFVLLKNPPGSNNRLNEKSQDRINIRRLFDSQNEQNAGQASPNKPLAFYEHSILRIAWHQHPACESQYDDCTTILQYICSSDLKDSNREFSVHKHHHNSKERQDYRNQGLHETEAYSRFCFTHERHPNIFIGDQRLCTASICTRDNPNAIKYGNECAEERSYYPYWAPSPWIDIAIFKKNASQCSNLIKQSQNTNSRSFCAFPSKRIAEHYRQFFGTLPISPKRCTQSKFSFNSTMTFSGKWHKGSKHNKSSPKCLKMHSRNSHYYDWRIPSLRQSKSHTKCVIRIRYNVTVFEARNPNEHTNRLKSHHPITSVDDSEIVVFPELKNFKLRLQNIRASDINQVFEDRSHVFEVIQRPPQVDVNQSIYNVNFVGHRQPDDEASNLINDIEFIPRVIHILNGTMVHMQYEIFQ